MQEIRTRFAPSPTGYMHIGGLRTALYAYLLAKANGGRFILRIEDTDAKRYVPGATEIIFRSLKTAGLIYDEGPDAGGEYGPYVQSERKDIYMTHAKSLTEKGAAYYCFCGDKPRAETAEQNTKYDRKCLLLSKNEIENKLNGGAPFVIRQLIPEGETTYRDHVYGEITIDNSELDDTVLIKSDGLPTYNFANVVDDHLMKITHVVRGSEFLSSTPKHVLLYNALGFRLPEYIHLPLVMNENGEKLSKRMGHASFDDLLDLGYLAETVVNYIALLGFTPAENKEILSLEELAECFDIKGISKSPSRFDIAKLTWMNGEYIKNMSDDAFFAIAEPILKQTIKTPGYDLRLFAAMVKTRVSLPSQISEMLDFVDKLPDYDTALYNHKKMKTDADVSLKALKNVALRLENAPASWLNDDLYAWLCALAAELSLKNGQILWPVRTALSGKATTPCGASELMQLFGKDESKRRIMRGIDLLEGERN